MKNTFLTALILLTGLLTTGSIARAQETLLVDVPHDFVVNGQSLPAGAYHIVRSARESISILQIRSADGRSSLFFLPTTLEDNVSETPQLTFVRIGEQYVLSAIQTPTLTYTLSTTDRKAANASRSGAAIYSGN